MAKAIPAESLSERRIYRAWWAAWWAAGFLVVFGAGVRMEVLSRPNIDADFGAKLWLFGWPLGAAAALVFAGHLIRKRDRGGVVLSAIMIAIIALSPQLFLLGNEWGRWARWAMLVLGALGELLIVPAWHHCFMNSQQPLHH